MELEEAHQRLHGRSDSALEQESTGQAEEPSASTKEHFAACPEGVPAANEEPTSDSWVLVGVKFTFLFC